MSSEDSTFLYSIMTGLLSSDRARVSIILASIFISNMVFYTIQLLIFYY